MSKSYHEPKKQFVPERAIARIGCGAGEVCIELRGVLMSISCPRVATDLSPDEAERIGRTLVAFARDQRRAEIEGGE